jgi:HK97 family phage portal protein
MGLLDFLRPREQFSQQWRADDPAFAAWWRGVDDAQESVTAYTVLGLSAVQRAVQIISTTIAGLPLKTYERDESGERVQVESVFDDPYPGIDGMTPFAWVETVLIHSLIWRHAFLWHEARMDGTPGLAYRPLNPDAILAVRRDSSGRRVFEYREPGGTETKEVGSEQITYIPGPSLDGTSGHPLLWHARSVFSAAISADKTTQRHLRKGIRLAGIVTPADAEEDFDETEGKAILEKLRASAVGSDNAGDIALINRRVKLDRWTATNIESQWHETLMYVLMEIEQLFGVPPHLMADTEKQTSWGTGVAEQNLSLARFTLRGWSDRIEQVLSRRLPAGQFVEFDYKGLLQGTPEDEVRLVLDEIKGGLLDIDEGRKVLNLPPRTPAQKTQAALERRPALVTDQEAE